MKNSKDTKTTQSNPQFSLAQQNLVALLSPTEVKDFLVSLKKVHYLATYCVEESMVELSHSGYVQLLIDALQELVNQKEIE
jgi:hypothetical protein